MSKVLKSAHTRKKKGRNISLACFREICLVPRALKRREGCGESIFGFPKKAFPLPENGHEIMKKESREMKKAYRRMKKGKFFICSRKKFGNYILFDTRSNKDGNAFL